MFIVDPRDFMISKQMLKNGAYDWDEIMFLKDYLNKNSTVIFVGCHIGALLIPIAQAVKKAYGFEANPKNFELLNYNLLLNRINNVEVKNIAIGEREKPINISHNITNTGNSSIALSTNEHDDLIEMKPLDNLITEENIDMIIMDIEGYEINAIRGAINTLKNTSYLYIEYAPEQLNDFGMKKKDFIDSVREIYSHMYLFKNKELTRFENKSWVSYLENLPEKRGLLLNLFFSNHILNVVDNNPQGTADSER